MAPYRQRKSLLAQTLRGLLYGGILLAAGSLPLRAEELEYRDFKVKVDGKAAGDYSMTISRHKDGAEIMAGKANVKVTFFGVPTYKYSYDGTEAWKDGRLWQLKSSTNDDGKKFTVIAVADGEQLRVTSNGKERTTRWDAWTTTYWRATAAKFRDQIMPLIDADTGKDIQSTLKFARVEAFQVAGQLQNCTHYTLRGGGLEVDVWYDPQDRLVREEAVEDGHRTVLELARIRR